MSRICSVGDGRVGHVSVGGQRGAADGGGGLAAHAPHHRQQQIHRAQSDTLLHSG